MLCYAVLCCTITFILRFALYCTLHHTTPYYTTVQVHHVTRQIEYQGELMSLTEAIVGFPVGGQVLISGSTYQRIYGRLHTIGPLHNIAVAPSKSKLGRSRSQRRLSLQAKEARSTGQLTRWLM